LECDPTSADLLQPVCPPNFHFDQLDPTKGESLMKSATVSFARLPRVVVSFGMAASRSLPTGKRPSFAILLVPKFLAVVLAAGLAIFAGTAEAAIVSLDAPFTVGQNFVTKYLNFAGNSLTGSDTQGTNGISLGNIYSNFYIGSNYAWQNSAPRKFNQGDIVSAATTDFSNPASPTTFPESSLTYYVLGFYNNTGVNSLPESNPPNPDNAFIANSNLAWIAVSRFGGDITVEAAGINTVAGGSIAVGEYVAPVPEPSTYAMALAGLACGGYSMFRRRSAR
jgi:hypothetical protein